MILELPEITCICATLTKLRESQQWMSSEKPCLVVFALLTVSSEMTRGRSWVMAFPLVFALQQCFFCTSGIVLFSVYAY